MDAVWPWKRAGNITDQRRGNRKRRDLIQFAVMFVAASSLLFVFHHVFLSAIIYFLSFMTLVGIFIYPRISRFFEISGKILTALIGRTLTCLLLVPFYYLCFFPGRVVLLVLRKDPMKRRLEDGSPTYWTEKKQSEDIDRYKVQYT